MESIKKIQTTKDTKNNAPPQYVSDYPANLIVDFLHR
jgi:hypothetical protein